MSRLKHFWVPHCVIGTVTPVLDCHFGSWSLRHMSGVSVRRSYVLGINKTELWRATHMFWKGKIAIFLFQGAQPISDKFDTPLPVLSNISSNKLLLPDLLLWTLISEEKVKLSSKSLPAKRSSNICSPSRDAVWHCGHIRAVRPCCKDFCIVSNVRRVQKEVRAAIF